MKKANQSKGTKSTSKGNRPRPKHAGSKARGGRR